MPGYKDRFVWEKTDRTGHEHKIIISKYCEDDNEVVAFEHIASLIDARLEWLGQQDDMPMGIIKTALTLTFVDISDNPVYTEDGEIYRQGNWYEFFTPDALKYRVIYYYDDWRTWSGYVTPDSFTEPLSYHGTISIVARDNLGLLDSIQFDYSGGEDGMAMLEDLFYVGLDRAGIDDNRVIFRQCTMAKPDTEMTALDFWQLCVNVATFRGETWGSVLGEVAHSFGLVIIWHGDGAVLITEAAHYPEVLYEDGDPETPIFHAGATREFVASVKEISESFDAEQGALLDFDATEDSYQVATINLNGEDYDTWEPKIWPDGDNPLRKNGEIGMVDPIGVRDPRSTLRHSTREIFLTACGTNWSGAKGDNCLYFKVPFSAADGRYKLSFDQDPTCYLASPSSRTIGVGPVNAFNLPHSTLYVRINYLEDGGTNHYYDEASGEWVDAETWISKEANPIVYPNGQRPDLPLTSQSVEFKLPTAYGAGILIVSFSYMYIGVTPYHGNDPTSRVRSRKLYGRIIGLKLEGEDMRWEGYDVTTKYNSKNNIRIERSPSLGQVLDSPTYNLFKNGIYIPTSAIAYAPATRFYYGGVGDPEALPVVIHRQILCYYSRPEFKISGDLDTRELSAFPFTRLFEYDGRPCILMSGAYVIGECFIESAVLRSFVSFNDLWCTTVAVDIDPPHGGDQSGHAVAVKTALTQIGYSPRQADIAYQNLCANRLTDADANTLIDALAKSEIGARKVQYDSTSS